MSKKTTVNGLKYFFLFYEFMVIGWLKVSLASLCCCCYFGYDAFVKTNLSSFEKLRWYKMIFAQLKYKYRTAGLFRQLKISCYSREAEFIRLQQDKLGSCLPPQKSNVSLSRGIVSHQSLRWSALSHFWLHSFSTLHVSSKSRLCPTLLFLLQSLKS